MWQDLALSTTGVVFTIMLIPQMYDGIRGDAILNRWTCLVTGIGCIVVGIIDITLNLPISAAVSASTGLMWLILLYYSETNRKRLNDELGWQTM